MPCLHSADHTVHICAPSAVSRSITREVCPSCKQKTRMISFHYMWYGWDSTCIRCGRQWMDGEWMELDFYRYARRDNINTAKSHWRRMTKANWKPPTDKEMDELLGVKQ